MPITRWDRRRKVARRRSRLEGEGLQGIMWVAIEHKLRQDVAADGVWKASRARAPDPPVPGEHRCVNGPARRRIWDGEAELKSEKLEWVGNGASATNPNNLR
jgi:hypothetical protein